MMLEIKAGVNVVAVVNMLITSWLLIDTRTAYLRSPVLIEVVFSLRSNFSSWQFS